MGAFLSSPDTDIDFGAAKSKELTAVVASMQGWRNSQEDAHLLSLNFDNEGSHLFGVFDGHGSSLISNYVADNFVSIFTSTPAYKEKNYSLALEQAFMRFDELLTDDAVVKKLEAGADAAEGRGDPMLSAMDAFKNKFRHLVEEEEDDENKNDENGDIESGVEVKLEAKNDKDSVVVKEEAGKDSVVKEEADKDSVVKEEADKDSVVKGEADKDSVFKGEADKKSAEDEKPKTEDGSDSGDNVVDLDVDEDDDEDFDEDGPELEDGCEEDEALDMAAMQADSVYQRKWASKLLPDDRDSCPSSSGTTANVVLIKNGKIYVANAGDSRSILATKDKIVALSSDHGPEVDSERERIDTAGGVIIHGRVNGGLNLTRAIGDLYYKRRTDLKPDEQLIISKPDVRTFDLEPTHRFLVLACDGIWNSLSNEETAKYFEGENIDVEKQLETMFMNILADGKQNDGLGMDNMSAIFVRLNESNTDDDLAKFAEEQKVKAEEKAKKKAEEEAAAEAEVEELMAQKRKLSDEDAEQVPEDDAPPAKMARE